VKRERRTENGERRTENGERRTENGERRTENGERRTENGERRTENGERRTENGERGTENVGRETCSRATIQVPAILLRRKPARPAGIPFLRSEHCRRPTPLAPRSDGARGRSADSVVVELPETAEGDGAKRFTAIEMAKSTHAVLPNGRRDIASSRNQYGIQSSAKR